MAEGPAESAEYRSTIQHAVEEFDAGAYAEARGLFMHAHELYPNARTLRGLGLVAFELRNYGVCVENLQAALASSEKPLTNEQRKATDDTLARAQAFIARVEVEVSPATARLLLDGVPVVLSSGQALVLEVGDHLVEVQASGYLPERRALTIGGGERLRLKVVMHQPEFPVSTTESTTTHIDDGQPVGRRWYKNPWLWTGVAVLVAGAATGLAVALRPDAKTETREPIKTGNTPNGGVLQSLGSW